MAFWGSALLFMMKHAFDAGIGVSPTTGKVKAVMYESEVRAFLTIILPFEEIPTRCRLLSDCHQLSSTIDPES